MNNPTPEAAVPGVLEILREATRLSHAEISACPAMQRLFDGSYTVTEYRAHLGRLLGLFEPLERAVALSSDSVAVHIPQRSLALRADLLGMGETGRDIDALERCRQVPTITPAGVRGCIYVLIGSMMGGTIIASQLRSVLGPNASYHFYSDGSLGLGALWASFRSDLEQNGKNHIEAICATAIETFDLYAAWLAEPILKTGNN